MKIKRLMGFLLVAFLAAPVSTVLAEELKAEPATDNPAKNAVERDQAGPRILHFFEMRDILLENVGKRVALRSSGEDKIEGVITLVGDNLVLLSELAGNESYDAVVDINSINAIWIKARDK